MKNGHASTLSTASFSTLTFIYDPSLQQIIFIDRDPVLFFGTQVDMRLSFPFHDLVHEEATPGIAAEWQQCLSLANHEQYQFSFMLSRNRPAPVVFHIRAAGFITGNNKVADRFVLFTVNKEIINEKESRLDDEYAEFIGIATHDLDAPLRKLSVWVEKLVSKYGHDEQKQVQEYVQRINSSLGSMRSLIDQLSVLSGLYKPAVITVCDLQLIVQDVLHELLPVIHDAKAVINAGILPVLQGDRSQYRLLFKNLLENALRFIKKDTAPLIHISSETVTMQEKQDNALLLSKEYIKIEIADNGTGIDPAFAGKIFRPFTRLHPKSGFPGNGIGLAIVNRIIINHGGIIYVHSAEHAGSRFIFILPQTIDTNAQYP